MAMTPDAVLAEVTAMLHATLNDDDLLLVISPATRFVEDLGMASIDMVALAGRLQARYGRMVNFARVTGELGANSFEQVTVDDLATCIAQELKIGSTP